MRRKNPRFLTLDQVLAIHEAVIRETGGSDGLREVGLLQSALAAPQATYGGKFLNDSPFVMAASYLVSLAKNHPFVDGNKRIAAVVALTFLDVNGYASRLNDDELVDLTLGVAEGRIAKAEAAVILKVNSIRP